jgi:anti-sigma factor RsiW
MCDMNGPRLLAWMDGEIETDEAELIAAHVHGCTECKASVARYRAISSAIIAYRDEVARGVRRFTMCRPSWIRAAAIAAVVLIAIVISRGVRGVGAGAEASPDVPRAASVIRVSVPIEDVLPAGAAPAGIRLQGELILAVDGAPVAIRLAP